MPIERTIGRAWLAVFGAPFFHIDLISLDWLPRVDLGISLDFIGSFFKYPIDQKLTGTVAEKYQHFYSRMQLFYQGHDIQSRLDQFKPSMLLNTSDGSKVKFPKLRAKAGESRALIPFTVLVGRDLLDQNDVLEKQLFESTVALDKCYQQLSSENFNAAELNKQSLAKDVLKSSQNCTCFSKCVLQEIQHHPAPGLTEMKAGVEKCLTWLPTKQADPILMPLACPSCADSLSSIAFPFCEHKKGETRRRNICSQQEVQDLLTKGDTRSPHTRNVKSKIGLVQASFCLTEMSFMFACSFLASNLVVGHGKQQRAAACRGLR